MGQAIVEIFASASSAQVTSSWVCPRGVTRVFVECWGAGGSGGGGTGTGADGNGGGGGGAYAASWVNTVPGRVYNYVIASASRGGIQGVAGVPGSGSWFGSITTVYAQGGFGGAGDAGGGTGGDGGMGGHPSGSVGMFKWAGGNGGKGRNQSAGRGASGGSSAGVEVFMDAYSGTGFNPMSISGSEGVCPGQSGATPPACPPPAFRAGPGGQALATLTNGYGPPSGPGGGGSGAAETSFGGGGYSGQVVLTYVRQSPSSRLIDTQDELNP